MMTTMNTKMKTEPDRYFYDTSSLLIAREQLLEDTPFYISSVSLEELEHIKSSPNKLESVRAQARYVLRLLEDNMDKVITVIHQKDYEDDLYANMDMTNDLKIIADAYHANQHDNIVFVSNDIAQRTIAQLWLGDGMIRAVEEEQDEYTGYKEVCPDEEELARFYKNPDENIFGCLTNEYVIVRDSSSKVLDIMVWRDNKYQHIFEPTFGSPELGKINPYHGDVYQKLAFDSLCRNQITMLRGPAGSGKSLISLAYLFSQLDGGRIDKLVIFCNPVATVHAAKLGYTPGSLMEKILDTQMGNILQSKLGDRYVIEQMMDEGKLILLPFSNIRGYDTTGMKAGIYITEAQNLDRSLMKLALQRVGDDCCMIIDGDDRAQVDASCFEGENNGMRRLSKVFRGKDIYGEVTLGMIHRSEIARIAEDI